MPRSFAWQRAARVIGDEPVSMLDASVRGEILKLLVQLKDEIGMTLVLVTHDLAFAWALAERVAVMYLGKIVELGPRKSSPTPSTPTPAPSSP